MIDQVPVWLYYATRTLLGAFLSNVTSLNLVDEILLTVKRVLYRAYNLLDPMNLPS
jgi:hypothetical protein